MTLGLEAPSTVAPWEQPKMRGNRAEQDVALDLSLALPLPTLSSCWPGTGKRGLAWLEARVGRPPQAQGLGIGPVGSSSHSALIERLLYTEHVIVG